MTQNEFRQWRDDFCTRFPDAGAWVVADERASLRELWYREVFYAIDLRWALAANAAMMAGVVERFNDFAKDQIATLISKAARELKAKHESAERDRQRRDSHRIPRQARGAAVMAQTLAAALRAPHGQRAAIVTQAFATDAHDDDRRNWYDCPQCRDTGYVDILAPETIHELRRYPESDSPMKTCTVACNCELGNRYGGDRKIGGRAVRIPVFGEPWHISAYDPDYRVTAATYEHRPANYSHDLAAFVGATETF